MSDIRDKIAKLLSLADSSNENEARAALLKARALMAQHKLCPEDIKRDLQQSLPQTTAAKHSEDGLRVRR